MCACLYIVLNVNKLVRKRTLLHQSVMNPSDLSQSNSSPHSTYRPKGQRGQSQSSMSHQHAHALSICVFVGYLKLRAEAVEKSLPCSVAIVTHSKGIWGKGSEYLEEIIDPLVLVSRKDLSESHKCYNSKDMDTIEGEKERTQKTEALMYVHLQT